MIKIFDVICNSCNKTSEVMFFRGKGKCNCGSEDIQKIPTITSIQTETSRCRYGKYTEKMTPLPTDG